MSTRKFIARNSMVVALILAANSILGIIRESSVAFSFGASGTTDVFLIASLIPTVLTAAISNAVTYAFITVYSGYLARGEKEKAWDTTNVVLSTLGLFLLGIMAIVVILSPRVVHLVAPSYDGEMFDLTLKLSWIMMPNLLFSGLVSILVGVNNANNSFIAPSSIGLVSNVFVIVSIYSLGSIWGIYGLAVGTMLGVVCQFILQIPSAKKHGFSFRFKLSLQDSGVREILLLAVPLILSTAVQQVNQIIDRVLATGLPAGVVSALYFANKLVFLPSVIFTAAIGMVVFPLMVNATALKDWPRLVEGINQAVRLLLLILLPAAMGLFVLRKPLVQMLFEHGSFTAESTLITAQTIPYFLGSLVFGGMVNILSNIYGSAKKMSYAVVASVAAMLTNIGLSLLLVGPMQQRGLALANSLAVLVNMLILIFGLFFVLRLHEKAEFSAGALFRFLLKVGIGTVAIGFTVWIVHFYLLGGKGTVFNTLASVIIGVFSYLLATYVLNIEEVRKAVSWGISALKSRITVNG